MNILYIDTETTGVCPKTNCIIEIAALLEIDGKIDSRFNTKLSLEQGKEISLGALKVNKTCIQDLISKVGRNSDLLKFVDFLLGIKISGPLYICGHNVHFDVAFIKETLKRELNVVDWDSAVSYRILDTSTIGTFLIESGVLKIPSTMPKGSSLEKLALALGIEVRGRTLHSAVGDVELTREVFNKLKQFVVDLSVKS